MKSSSLAGLLLLAVVTPTQAQSITSTYTDIDLGKCRLSGKAGPDDGEWASWSCRGHAGVAVRILEGDLRFFVSYGSAAEQQCAVRQTFGAFNRLGPTIEWRLEGGKPFATILRWHTENENDKYSWLVVTKLDENEACHMAYVDASLPDANAIARQRADHVARTFDCRNDEVEIVSPRRIQLSELASGTCNE